MELSPELTLHHSEEAIPGLKLIWAGGVSGLPREERQVSSTR